MVDQNANKEEWLDHGIEICKAYKNLPTYLIKLIKYLRLKHEFIEALKYIDKLIANSKFKNTNYFQEAIQIKEEIEKYLNI